MNDIHPVLLLLVPAIAIAAIFFLVWRIDARRSERQEHDPERADVAPTGRRRRRRRGGE